MVNQRFDPTIVKGEKGLNIIETVIRTYFDTQHGQHIQLNVVDNETLCAAQKEPQKYRNIFGESGRLFCILRRFGEGYSG